MTGAAFLALAGVILSPLPLLYARQGTIAKTMRGLLHTLAMAAFAAAAWRLSAETGLRSGLITLLAGSVWSGVFWMISIRRRLHSRVHASRVEHGPAADSEGAAGAGAGEAADSAGSLRTERAFLSRMMDLKHTKVGEILVPREEIVSADCSRGIEAALRLMQRSGFVRIPMTDGNLDRIVGVLHAKDLVPLVLDHRPLPSLKGVMRRPLFVSQDRTVSSLLELFRSQRGHMAIVVDDISRTVGIATRDDIFRFLSGGGEGDR